MEKFDIEKIKGYIRENKVKSGLIASGVLLILVLVVNGLMALFSDNNRSYSAVANYGYDQEMIELDYAAPMMGKAMVAESRMATDIMPYPVNPSEGVYDEDVERKVIKNGNLSLVVKNIDVAKIEIENITQQFNGLVSSSNFSENEEYDYYRNERRLAATSKRGYFEVKVPSESFGNAFSAYKKTALKVNNESTSGNDVTEQYSDLETQIKNKTAEVNQYRNILNRASKIEDVLKTTQYLNNAQSQLERLRGRMNYLSNQVEMSTIRIDLVSEKDVAVFGVVWSPLSELKQGFSNMVSDMKDFANDVIAFAFKLPIYILYIGAIILAGRIIWKLGIKLKRKVWVKKK